MVFCIKKAFEIPKIPFPHLFIYIYIYIYYQHHSIWEFIPSNFLLSLRPASPHCPLLLLPSSSCFFHKNKALSLSLIHQYFFFSFSTLFSIKPMAILSLKLPFVLKIFFFFAFLWKPRVPYVLIVKFFTFTFEFWFGNWKISWVH